MRTLENTLDIAKSYGFTLSTFSQVWPTAISDGKSVDENTQCNHFGIYGTLKHSGELIVKAYHRVFNIPYTIVRPSALYGERCVSRRVSQIFIENAVQDLDITINGDGADLLDFTYIDDLTQGIILAIEKRESQNEKPLISIMEKLVQ